jgi:hypothetical protein
LKAAAAAAALAVPAPLAAQVRTRLPVAAKPAEPSPETPPLKVEVLTNESPGSDFMVDVIKSLGMEYATANPASSCRALHESIVNYGGNKAPEPSLMLLQRSNYQDFARYNEADMAIAGDGEARLPALIEARKRALTPDRQRALEERGARLAEVHQRREQQTREQAALGWDSIPLTPARVSGERWTQIKNQDWTGLWSAMISSSAAGRRDFGTSRNAISTSAAQVAKGLDTAPPAAVGAALAIRNMAVSQSTSRMPAI